MIDQPIITAHKSRISNILKIKLQHPFQAETTILTCTCGYCGGSICTAFSKLYIRGFIYSGFKTKLSIHKGTLGNRQVL